MKISLRTLEGPEWFVLAALLFRSLLEVSYLQFVNPLFEYAGFLLDVSHLKYVESWLLYLFFLAVSPKKLNRPSDYLVVTLLFLFVSPLLVFYSLSDASREHLYIVLFGVMLIHIFRSGRPLKLPIVKGAQSAVVFILWFGALGVTALMIKNGGLNFFNLNLMRVYEFRPDASEAIDQGRLAYLNAWAKFVFGPMLLAIALRKKNYIMASAVLFLFLIWFGITSHKGVLFYPLLVIFAWLWFRHTSALSLLPLGMSFVIASAMLAYLILGDTVFGSLFIRRVFFVPSFLTFTYYDFFSQNQLVYWSSSITSGFIDYPYNLHPAKVIGNYLGTSQHANNSFISTGYMHAGVSGVIFYGILVGLLFRLIDSVAKKGVPLWFAVAAIIVPGQTLLTSGDLPTSLLTGGMGLSLFLLFLYRSDRPRQTFSGYPRLG